MRAAALALAVLFAGGAPAAGEDGPLRRTTPRASLAERDGALVLGVPGGRAWGIETPFRRAPRRATELAVDLGVADAPVREAFVRVAWYARASGRQRQIEIVDSDPVAYGERRAATVALDPPEGAVAYKVRVLVRLVPGALRSAPDAVTIGAASLRRAGRPGLTRLLSDLPP